MSSQRTAGPADAAGLATDDAAWDEFVARAPNGAYPQLSAWAEVKAATGWRAERVLVGDPSARVGAQLLLHDIGPTPWQLAYAPRGPIADRLDAQAAETFTGTMRELARGRRLSHVAVDPQVEAGDVFESHLRAAGWRPAAPIQPDRTRLLDLAAGEEALWGDLRKKWRQYVTKARRSGVVVVERGHEGLDDFYDIYVETARRAGFVHRARAAYAAVYEAYARRGAARLLFARLADGSPGAALLLLHCGPTVIEPYGGMTRAGAESRANYLLKWEAIRSSQAAGFERYDMWGLSHPGIEHFKAGFGGREVRWTGTWELVLDPLVRGAVGAAQRLRVLVARRRQGVRGASGGMDAA
ncbi:MAG TPA: peptidoglycan bridge formation glycyltransferase FemA/FemB family protein [Candidatus Limnocylindrales bacterium]|nr:peptidoglycan bridge formation glycyltransferase FemA/FemB family protein [Candidatus Limnocylindrales bacterium]